MTLTRYSGNYKRITFTTIDRLVEKYSIVYKLPVTPHRLRHTLDSELYLETKNQVFASQQLVQKNNNTTDL